MGLVDLGYRRVRDAGRRDARFVGGQVGLRLFDPLHARGGFREDGGEVLLELGSGAFPLGGEEGRVGNGADELQGAAAGVDRHAVLPEGRPELRPGLGGGGARAPRLGLVRLRLGLVEDADGGGQVGPALDDADRLVVDLEADEGLVAEAFPGRGDELDG